MTMIGIMALGITASLLVGAGAVLVETYNVLTKWE